MQQFTFFFTTVGDTRVGEAERQLRLLFEQVCKTFEFVLHLDSSTCLQAQRMQPAIIFFDEIDGLAPVRSSKQDQIHSSIVSTLLALMDGLDSRFRAWLCIHFLAYQLLCQRSSCGNWSHKPH